jgi:threonine dehydrogenase-like Zn-dependent dehydrogenase
MAEKKNVVLTIPEPQKVALKERPYPKIVPGYLMIQVEIAPICIEHQIYRDHTFEWHEDEEHLGHEGVGTVIEVAEGSKFQVGDRVIIYQGNACGECFVCKEGLSPTHCMNIPYEEITGAGDPYEKLESLGGGNAMNVPGGMNSIAIDCESESGAYGFAKYRIAPEINVQKIPDDLPFKYAAAANCSCGCTFSPVREHDIKEGDWVLAAGIGFIGFGVIIAAKYYGANVIVLGRNEFRMDIARKLGADYIINPDDPNWLEQVRTLTGEKQGCDYVFEASGYPYYQKRCLQAVRRYGHMHLLGFLTDSNDPYPMQLLDEIHNRHVHLTGSHDVRFMDREALVKMLMDPEVQKKVDLMVTHEFNMSDGAAAFEAALSKKAGKVYLYPQENCPE